MEKLACPCCGLKNLDVKPYERFPSIAESRNKPTPYGELWGMGSYEVCACCQYEFGFDDEPSAGQPGLTFEEHLKEWIHDDCQWLIPSEKPQGWGLAKQLREAGIEDPRAVSEL